MAIARFILELTVAGSIFAFKKALVWLRRVRPVSII